MRTRSLNKAINEAEKRVRKSVKEYLVPHAIDLEIESIQVYAYDVYPSPSVYERRYGSGGLIDRSHFKTRIKNDGMAYEIENVTPGKNNRRINVAELVYGGDGYKGMKYDYPSEEKRGDGRYTYLRVRDYISPTVEALKATAKDVMIGALMKQGSLVNG